MNWKTDRRIWTLLALLTGISIFSAGCTYDSYSDLSCSTTSECPDGAVCRSGYCAQDGETNNGNNSNNNNNGTPTLVRVAIVPQTTTTIIGSTLTFVASGFDENDVEIPSLAFTWSVADTGVASIDQAGVLQGLDTGVTTVTASSNGIEDEATITVTTNVDAVVVTPGTTDLGEGVELQFSASANDANGVSTGRAVTWGVSDPSIISVSAEGLVRGLTIGSASVTATSDGIEGSATVNVVAVEPTSLTISPSSVRIPHGGIQVLNSVLLDENSNEIRGRDITWAYNPAVGGFSYFPGQDSATYTASTTLETTITVTATFAGPPELVATAELVVYRPVVDTVAILPANPTPYLGETITMTTSVIDTDGNAIVGRATTWSSDPSIVDIDSVTGEATFVGAGTADITATVDTVMATTTATVTIQLDDVSGGDAHSCGIAPNGRGLCWGRGNNGRLGTGSSTAAQVPTLLDSDLAFTEVRAGNQHSCGLSAGDIYCWGQDNTGRLGTSTANDPASPGNPVDGTEVYTQVDTSRDHTCGVTDQNDIFCWGSGGNGRLGDGATADNTAPTKISDPAAQSDFKWSSVSTGREHTCAIAMSGDTYCWGKGDLGQLGDGLNAESLIPVLVDTSGVSNVQFTSITAGRGFSCGITSAGVGYCWGDNALGQIGAMSATLAFATPTAVSGSNVFTQIEAGTDHVCGVTSTDVYCWGAGTSGQLGTPTAVDATAPAIVSGSLVFTSIGAGGLHTCGTTATVTYCWGENADYQLGDNTADQRLTPKEVGP